MVTTLPNLSLELQNLRDMPEKTLEQRGLKEKTARFILSQQFHIDEEDHQDNSILNAAVTALTPFLDRTNKDVVADIVKGDIVFYIQSHERQFNHLLQNEEKKEIMRKHGRFDPPSQEISLIELKAFSEMSQRPIFVYSYQDININENYQLVPSKNLIFGDHFHEAPLHVYYNPISHQYYAMVPR